MENMRLFRKKQGKSLADVANITGISIQRLSHYETKRSEPDLYVLSKIADCFGVSIDNLVGRTIDTTSNGTISPISNVPPNIQYKLDRLNDKEIVALDKFLDALLGDEKKEVRSKNQA